METKVSRRRLLGGAAGVALPTFIPAHVLAKPGKRQGANDRIVVANIGVGGMGRTHVSPDTAALCDVDETRMADVAKTVMQSGKRTVASPPDLVKDFRR